MYTFMLIAFGQMLVEVVFIIERTLDFYEMLLHHIIHLSLYLCGLVENYQNAGVVLVFTHCFSDIFLQLSKMMHMLGLMKGPGYIIFAFSHVSWIWLRLFSLPMFIHNRNESLAMTMRPELDHLWTYCQSCLPPTNKWAVCGGTRT